MSIRGRERTAWQDIYAIQQTSDMIYVGEYDADSDIGIMGDAGASEGRFLMKLTDHPHLQPASSSLEQELATGLSQRRQDDFTPVSSELASVTLNMQAHAWNMSLFLRGLFQDGSREIDASLMNQVSMPYQIPDVVDFMAMTRVLDQKGPAAGRYPNTAYVDPLDGAGGGGSADTDFTSHFMTGMVPRSIALTAEEGNILQMAVDCAGAHVGVQGVAGVIDTQTLTTRRLRCYPTPAQLGEAGENAAGSTNKASTISVWIGGVLVANTYLRTSSEEFNAGGVTDTVEIAVDTGEMNFTSILAINGSWVQHDAYRTGAGTLVYRHPFELLPDLKAPLLWQNAQVKMRRMDLFGDHEIEANAWIDVKLPGFTLTFTNNLVGYFYNNPVLTKYLLGRLDTEGTVTIPWGTDKDSITPVRPSMGGNNSMVDFMNGIPSRLRILWGQTTHAINASGAATGYTTSGFHYVDPEVEGAVAIDLAIRHTDQNVEGENELGQAMTFTTVDDLGIADITADAISPDLDKTLSSRVSIGYTKGNLDRGQGGALEYPESTGPT